MKLGRLFWKFFIVFWLAQLVTSIGVGVMISALRPPHPGHWPPPPPHEIRQSQEQMLPPGPPPPPPRHHLLPPLLPILAGGVVSLVFAWRLAGYFARPIRSLRSAFEAEASGQLDTRVGAAMGRRKDELADLGTDFDRMAERLQKLVDGQRRLLHDVSHELRSPLARLQAATDLMRQQPERAPEFIERIQRDTRRIDFLVGELLTLARLDAGTENIVLERFDLAQLIEEVSEDARFEAETHGCRLDLDLTAAFPVDGNVDLLRRALDNVLRNAVRHTPSASSVKVAARNDNGYASVSVTDAGGGVDEADLDTIFEPFYRAANAKPFEGYGLGLAIARQVLRLHGGTINAENCPGEGFVVTLRLPLAHSG